jgi:hypothetical protein
MNVKRIDDVGKYGKAAKDRLELIKHLDGKKITIRQAARAYCYYYMGYFADGKVDNRQQFRINL